jgi:hypothetical protein
MNRRNQKIDSAFENEHIVIYKSDQDIRIRRKRDWRCFRKSVLAGLCLIGGTVGLSLLLWQLWQRQARSQASEPFRLAVNRAISAAELTQTAETREEWQAVANWWLESVELMQEVPAFHPQRDIAQAKVEEYGHNHRYAMQQAEAAAQAVRPVQGLWHIGSSRGQLLQIQGQPSHTLHYTSQCKEVFYYNDSRVEVTFGRIAAYNNADNNLKVVPLTAVPTERPVREGWWSLGSTKDEVLAIQGTPTQVTRRDSLHQHLLYYGSSSIEFKHDRVIAYDNAAGNLNVTLETLETNEADRGSEQPASPFWTMDSTQEEVTRVQGTPTQIVRDPTLCQEQLHYGRSIVEFHNGALQGYYNYDDNLKVK